MFLYGREGSENYQDNQVKEKISIFHVFGTIDVTFREIESLWLHYKIDRVNYYQK